MKWGMGHEIVCSRHLEENSSLIGRLKEIKKILLKAETGSMMRKEEIPIESHAIAPDGLPGFMNKV